ncbi:hypothetical protein MHBO_000461 [Bonamia ostreae]|uniref:Uncharacterized protein n=1 Tax=Bonamia ostreae TaxID=126728 RepID=A0ABV2AFS2_9EUKA
MDLLYKKLLNFNKNLVFSLNWNKIFLEELLLQPTPFEKSQNNTCGVNNKKSFGDCGNKTEKGQICYIKQLSYRSPLILKNEITDLATNTPKNNFEPPFNMKIIDIPQKPLINFSSIFKSPSSATFCNEKEILNKKKSYNDEKKYSNEKSCNNEKEKLDNKKSNIGKKDSNEKSFNVEKIDADKISHRLSINGVKILYEEKLITALRTLWCQYINFLICRNNNIDSNNDKTESKYKKLKIPKKTFNRDTKTLLVTEIKNAQINLQIRKKCVQIVFATRKLRLQVEKYFYRLSTITQIFLEKICKECEEWDGSFMNAFHFAFEGAQIFLSPTDIDVYNQVHWIADLIFGNNGLLKSIKYVL